MAVPETIAPETKERASRIGEADLVIALPSCHSRELLDAAVAALRPVLQDLLPDRKAVILHPETAKPSTEESNEPAAPNALLHLFPYPPSPAGRYQEQPADRGFRSLLQVGNALGARAGVMMSSEEISSIAEGFRALAEPVLNHGFDLAVPLYARRKFDSLINIGIVYPLTRAVYGARLLYPMATDLALSAKLMELCLQPSDPAGQPQPGWITTKAVCAEMQICQVHRGVSPPPIVSEPTDLSASLAQVLSALFLDMERNASVWQKVRGSQPVRTFGQPAPVADESATVDVHEMIEIFQRGCKDLLDIWAMALSPATLLDLKKLARASVDQFHQSDALWVHVLYDFLLGHRQRVISREHLLRAMTPIYLGWVATYALEVQNSSPGMVDDRIERLCAEFEELKPYLLSRWRWPDRFNP
jgi:hypothetical protein